MEPQDILKKLDNSTNWLSCRRIAAEIKKLTENKQLKFNRQIKIAYLSTFTIEPLADFVTLEAAKNQIYTDTYIGGYGQINQEILNPQSQLYNYQPDLTVIISEPESLAKNPVNAAQQLLNLVDKFTQCCDGIIVICTLINTPCWPLHILPAENKKLIDNANKILLENLSNKQQVQICDLDELGCYFGYRNALSPETMSIAKIPFSEEFLKILAQKILSHINARLNILRKCLVLDCDNTLWGGIIGEDGFDGIHLGQDWPGREFFNFQKAILELYHQGIILAINSRNNYEDVMKVLKEHPHMLLREEHFAGIQVNWDSKPLNMQRLAEEINIGIDSMVFVDDSPAEREMMRQMLPQVYTIEMPKNPSLFERTLRETNLFARAFLTEEDKKRGRIYAAQRQRTKLQQSMVNLEDFLKSLEMLVSIRKAQQSDIKRVAQLTQRTNQFNLTTRRYSESDIKQKLTSPNWTIYALKLKDKFGDNGTVGVAIIEKKKTAWEIDTFLMSCRVIGRQAEDALVDRIINDAEKQNVSDIIAKFIPSPKNKLVADFWDRMGFSVTEKNNKHALYYLNSKQYETKKFKYLKLT